jgi:hypothetical protein
MIKLLSILTISLLSFEVHATSIELAKCENIGLRTSEILRSTNDMKNSLDVQKFATAVRSLGGRTYGSQLYNTDVLKTKSDVEKLSENDLVKGINYCSELVKKIIEDSIAAAGNSTSRNAQALPGIISQSNNAYQDGIDKNIGRSLSNYKEFIGDLKERNLNLLRGAVFVESSRIKDEHKNIIKLIRERNIQEAVQEIDKNNSDDQIRTIEAIKIIIHLESSRAKHGNEDRRLRQLYNSKLNQLSEMGNPIALYSTSFNSAGRVTDSKKLNEACNHGHINGCYFMGINNASQENLAYQYIDKAAAMTDDDEIKKRILEGKRKINEINVRRAKAKELEAEKIAENKKAFDEELRSKTWRAYVICVDKYRTGGAYDYAKTIARMVVDGYDSRQIDGAVTSNDACSYRKTVIDKSLINENNSDFFQGRRGNVIVHNLDGRNMVVLMPE